VPEMDPAISIDLAFNIFDESSKKKKVTVAF
jgi:hypothetical protein